METNKMRLDRNICFWLGVAVISLINIALYLFHKNQIVYDAYILGISIILLIVFTIILIVRNKNRNIK
ncbi:MAG: hypothetical protein NTX24_02480 [Candidatus Pacearchaeota archaeon]|nr:hypothetical protein [Candidatus Pacearchaeota archaeon]